MVETAEERNALFTAMNDELRPVSGLPLSRNFRVCFALLTAPTHAGLTHHSRIQVRLSLPKICMCSKDVLAVAAAGDASNDVSGAIGLDWDS